ncbi:Class E vacuolar protein-sorting machinery protein HSE1 [Pleurotus pulmonarius]
MFGGGGNNPYDDIVVKTTDENLTSENWELILNLCDKVNDEGQEGAHNVIAAILKRLAHRNPNVQLYALTLAEALSKNCGVELHREIASRAFTQGLEKLIADRTTHEKVKRRTLALIAQWTSEFESNPDLGVMEDCYKNLKAKNHKFEAPQEPPPPTVDDEIRRKEEEELQRVLEMSMQDKGGRTQWQSQYSLVGSGSGAGASSSSANRPASSSSISQPIATNITSASKAYNQPLYQSGYVPARTPSPKPQPQSPVRQSSYHDTTPAPITTSAPAQSASTPVQTTSTPAVATTPTATSVNIVTRVRALHTFEPTEPGELAFEKGDIIKVVDRGYKDWWRGQLKGRTGIFPVNYVEPMPEPTATELAKEIEQEAAVFSQAVNVEKLLVMLRALDPAKDNLADNEEIQELYRSSMALRPKIVKLIDKYSQKRADLVSMNETFLRARSIFDRMMEESLARHTGVYDAPYRPSQYPRPDSRGHDYAPTPAPPQTFGWNPAVYDQPGYNAFPAPASAYNAAPPGPDPSMYPPGGASYVDPNAYGPQGPTPYPAQQQQAPISQQAPPQQTQPQQVQPLQPTQPQQQAPQQAPQQSFPQQPQQPQQAQAQAQQVQQSIHATTLAHTQSYSAPQDPTAYAAQDANMQTQAQPQIQQGPSVAQTQVQSQVEPQTQVQSTEQPIKQQSGPPYAFDPHTTYADPNVQAWAQYYAKGGTDMAGTVYFISVPGLTDAPAPVAISPVATQQQQQPEQPAQTAQPTVVHQAQAQPLPTSPQRASSIPDPYAAQFATATTPQSGNPGEYAVQGQEQTQQAANVPNASITPSWLLPRHPSAKTGMSSSPPPQSPGQGNPAERRTSLDNPHAHYYGGTPAQQFAGLNLSDNPAPKPLGA